MFFSVLRAAFFAATSLLLAACGGGGDSGSPEPATSILAASTPALPTVTLPSAPDDFVGPARPADVSAGVADTYVIAYPGQTATLVAVEFTCLGLTEWGACPTPHLPLGQIVIDPGVGLEGLAVRWDFMHPVPGRTEVHGTQLRFLPEAGWGQVYRPGQLLVDAVIDPEAKPGTYWVRVQLAGAAPDKSLAAPATTVRVLVVDDADHRPATLFASDQWQPVVVEKGSRVATFTFGLRCAEGTWCQTHLSFGQEGFVPGLQPGTAVEICRLTSCTTVAYADQNGWAWVNFWLTPDHGAADEVQLRLYPGNPEAKHFGLSATLLQSNVGGKAVAPRFSPLPGQEKATCTVVNNRGCKG